MKLKWAICTAVTLAVLAATVMPAMAQGGREKTEPDASQGASVSQIIGVNTKITVDYHRPGVKGRAVWTDSNSRGQRLVPHDGDPIPWRAGANETTKFTFSDAVKIEGKEIPAGSYGFHIIPTDGKWILIFSKDWETWGSFSYNEENDALRVEVAPVEVEEHQEWLAYGFEKLEDYGCTAYLHWDTKKIPFKIEVEEPEG